MKTYEKMSYGENMSWCKPYISEDERYALAINEGEIITIQIDGRDIDWDDKEPIYGGYRCSKALLQRLARFVNPDYDMYKGYTDTYIILDALEERGCAECPWRDECDAMIEEDDEAV